MKLIAIDTLHISAVGPDAIRPGAPFELNDGDAKNLISRGLAKRAPIDKKAPAAKNKVAPQPANKATD